MLVMCLDLERCSTVVVGVVSAFFFEIWVCDYFP